MRGDLDTEEPRPEFFGMQIGVVTHRDDPDNAGRVRVRIPGLVEPASAWAYPIGAPGGGSDDRGYFDVPEVDAEVAVWFKGGDPDHPYYLPGNWGRGEAPQGGDPDVKALAFGEYDVVVDTRIGRKKLSIVDRLGTDNVVEFDGVQRTLRISSTTSIRIESTGQIEINGLLVTVNGVPAGFGRL